MAMIRGLWLVLPACLLAAAAHAADGPVTLAPDAIAAGHVELTQLTLEHRTATLTAFGQVLDPTVLISLSAQLLEARAQTAAAEAKQSLARTNADRAAKLFHAERNISTADLQSAESAARVAAAEVEVAKARQGALEATIRAGWGAALAPAIQTGGKPLPALRAGSACLIQAVLPFGHTLPAAPAAASATTADHQTLALTLIGPSARLPDGAAGQAFLYLGAAPGCPPIGMPLQIGLPDGPDRKGVFVPASAVVWRSAQAIVFQADGRNSFRPTAIDTAFPQGTGYFVPATPNASLQPGTSIVVRGAALVLSESQLPAQKAAPAAGDDDDD
ncbi:MAG TPA: hypothetical protein PLD10_19935 [Rhodopila sp.]|nr:hypothetical protein [Rhodopila sp.]